MSLQAGRKRNLRGNQRRCPVCSRDFAKTEHLERHIRSHTKEKPFQCQQCSRRYGRNDSLLRHIKDQHKQIPNNGVHDRDPIQVSINNDQTAASNRVSNAQTILAPDKPSNTLLTGSGVDGGGIPYQDHFHSINPIQTTSIENQLDIGVLTTGNHWSESAPDDSHELFSGTQHSLELSGGLSHFDLDSVLRSWPFAVDDSEWECAAETPIYYDYRPLPNVQHSWHTYVDKDELGVSACPSPPHAETLEVDDDYRQRLDRRLEIRILDQKLPSAQYLNLCVRAYFKQFHPIFPIVHAATFHPSRENAVLTLSICSIGSLLTGHPSAVQKGTQLFERLNKAILSNWETLIRRSVNESFAMVQAALLGQTFGLLSGLPRHLMLIDSFHGTIIAWARRAKVFHPVRQDLVGRDLKSRWQEWAKSEERTRLALAVRIHDTEIASTLHHETFLPPISRNPLIADSDNAFFASTAQEWSDTHRATADSPTPTTSVFGPDALFQRVLSIPVDRHFSTYSALLDIFSMINEARLHQNLTDNLVMSTHDFLMSFHRQYLRSQGSKHATIASPQVDTLVNGNHILWHLLFLAVHADLELLERGVGRDGPSLDQSDRVRIRDWALSDAAGRCVGHAIMIKQRLERSRIMFEPGLHLPRALFHSAICLLCYSIYGDGGREEHFEFPEFALPGTDMRMLLQELEGVRDGAADKIIPVYGIVDLLQRIGHWGIARKFASILNVVVHEGSQ